ncbi:MAG: CPXCG motif-containing cysteine-rich protein [Gammaproteobacteria bacterium]|nr:CPXCG motif-containing cysteine-rich protein [Gammaproteobacteria bacterium]MDH3768031.1 CPXCG motif-containing cysteine-rich protein [Gammaproteobacteria bacterium]
MTDLLVERAVTCPSCWEQHIVSIDLTEPDKRLIEDCYVCCNPMRINFEVDNDSELVSVIADAL